MRILASNPDTLGDLILRQPLYAAMAAAGHELMLIVRPSVRDALLYIAPGAQVVELPYEVYADDVDQKWDLFAPVIEAVKAFEPDVLLIAPYRWTAFEEHLADALPPTVKRIGMNGYRYAGDPHAGNVAPSHLRLDQTVDVQLDQFEIDKNAALAVALGLTLESTTPRIVPTENARASALHTLNRLGFSAGEYWVVCVTGTAHVTLKTWPAEKWSAFLNVWSETRPKRKFLFIGLPNEREDMEVVRSRLPAEVASRTAIWAEQNGSLDELIAIIALSSGYAGHDTGPMHLAAALDKPVLALFGGGSEWRFAPNVRPSVSLMVYVPCVGCAWSCSFSTSHCVKQISLDEVLTAARDLDEGRVIGDERRSLAPGEALLKQMVQEAADLAQKKIRDSAQLAQDVRTANQSREEASAETARARGEFATLQVDFAQLRDGRDVLELEANSLRQGRDAFEAEAKRLAEELEAEKNRFAGADAELALYRATSAELSTQLGEQAELLQKLIATPIPAVVPPAVEADPFARLRIQFDRLQSRVRELLAARTAAAASPTPRRIRRPWRQVVSDLVTGEREYPLTPPRPLPRVTIVMPVLNSPSDARRTIESVVAQHFHDLEFIVVDGNSTDATRDVLDEFGGKIDVLIREPDDGPMHAVSKGFQRATGEIIHFIFAGDVLEPGAALRVSEYFSERFTAQAAYFEDTVTTQQGWRIVPPRTATLDVYTLLGMDSRVRNGVWIRRDAYERLGPLDLTLGRAADWDLFARLDRRWELRRAAGQVRSLAYRPTIVNPSYRADLDRARQLFLSRFPAIGRARCKLIHVVNQFCNALAHYFCRDPLHFPCGEDANKLPPVDAPAFVPGQPVSALSNRHPDRLLYSAPDTYGGDRGLNYIYYDTHSGAAITYPPITLERLSGLYESRARDHQAKMTVPETGIVSPFAGYTGSAFARLLSKVPSPYWWFHRPGFAHTTADDLLDVLSSRVSINNETHRLLVVGSFEGQVLDVLKQRTQWKLAGTETNQRSIPIARHKGHTIWEASPMDAASTVPTGELFDIIFLDAVVEHMQDPLMVIRRLRSLLVPGGLIVVNQPNLDSAHVKLFGPTWIHWQPPYHRMLMGSRAVKRLAYFADMKLVKLLTRTHPYPTTASAQLNTLGLAGIVPEGATFSNEISSQGVRLTGWSRLLWDWRGKGDTMYAVLKAL